MVVRPHESSAAQLSSDWFWNPRPGFRLLLGFVFFRGDLVSASPHNPRTQNWQSRNADSLVFSHRTLLAGRDMSGNLSFFSFSRAFRRLLSFDCRVSRHKRSLGVGWAAKKLG